MTDPHLTPRDRLPASHRDQSARLICSKQISWRQGREGGLSPWAASGPRELMTDCPLLLTFLLILVLGISRCRGPSKHS